VAVNTSVMLLYFGLALRRFYHDRGIALGVRTVAGYFGVYLVTASIMVVALVSSFVPMVIHSVKGRARGRVPAAQTSSPHAGAPASH